MAERVRAFDWARTPLGPMESWPQSLRTAVDVCLGSRFPMFLWWGPGLVNVYNDAYAPVLGRRHPGALGRGARELWAEVWPAIGPQVDAVLARGESSWHERVPLVVERNGFAEEAFFTWSHSPVRDESGRVMGVLCVVTEDTASVRAERERDRLAERSRQILESITDAFFAVDVEWRFTYVNRQARAVLGREADELLGRVLWEEYPGLVGSEFEAAYRRAAAERVAGSVTAFYADHDRYYEVHAYPAEGGGISVYFRNATERVRAEERLRRNHETFYNLIQNDPFGVYVVDADFRLREVSRGAQNVFAHVPRPLLGRDFAEVLRIVWPEPFASEAIGRFRHTLATGEAYAAPSTVERRRDIDDVEAYDWRIERVTLPDGSFGVVCYFYDLTERQRLEAALRDSEARFRLMADAIPQIVWITDGDGRALFFNQQWTNYTGAAYEPTTTAAEVAGSFLHPDDAAATMAAFEEARRTGTTFRVEHRIRSRAGEYRWFLVRGEPYRDPQNGAVVRWFGASIDIDDRRRAEAALRESERRLRVAQNAASLGTWELDLATGAAVWSEGIWRLIEQEPGGRAADWGLWNAHLHPDDLDGAMAEFNGQAASGREDFYLEFRVVTPARGARWLACKGQFVRDAGGVATRAYGANYDITERRRAEQALRDSQERLALAVAIARMGTFEIDLASDAVTVNEAGRAIYGWPAGEPLTFAKVQAHFHPDDRDEVMRRVGEALRPDGAGEFEVEQRIRRTDGAERWIRVRGRGLFDTVGGALRAVRCVGTYLDVTDQKELLASERAARAEAERQSRMKDEFLATLSHELRTPLNAIMGWAQILRAATDGTADEDVRLGLEVIDRNARAQTRIIEDLLEMSRIIAGKVRLDVQRVEVAGVVEAAVQTVRHAADAKGVRLDVGADSVGGSGGAVAGDPARLQQVFWNLLSNSVKHTPRGGHVRVSVERDAAHVRVAVADDGEGIAPEFLPHVFDRFRQADGTTTRRHGGLGLGLSIVKQLVELHGGTVAAASAGPGRGATFVVTLPLAAAGVATVASVEAGADEASAGAAAVRRATAAGRPCVNLAGVRVLVVDDEADARDLVGRLLDDCGAVTTVVGSAAEAAGAVARAPFDVIVSDIGMPDEDGYGLIRRVRALPAGRGGLTPAVALTAYARSEDRTRALLEGFQIHLSKPVEPAELIVAVASLAGRARGVGE